MSIVDMEGHQFPSNNLSKNLANVAINNVNEAIMITNKHNQIIYVNNKFEQMTGYTFAEINGKTPKALQAGIHKVSFYERMKENVIKNGKWKGEIWNRAKDGEVYLQTLSIIAIKNESGYIGNFIGIFSGPFHNKTIETEHVHNEAYYDSLTSLPKRAIFEKRVTSSIKLANETKSPFAIIFFQLNDFSSINEKYGFIYGDIILKRIATRLMSSLPNICMITRWHGTEFVCIFENVINEDYLLEKVKHLQRTITTPFILNGMEVRLQANFGVSLFQKDGKTVSDLLSKANTAMAVARERKELLLFYNDSMEKADNVFIMELELKKAIKEEQFELYYQPLISVHRNELVGFEALIRWNHPTVGLISPIKFIPLAEQTGLIEEIGQLVFKKACIQQQKWTKRGYENINISVNVSMNQFKDDYFVENIKGILQETEVNPNDMSIELTESSLIDDMEKTTLKLHQLHKLGLSIAIDDFGTGYSSLGYLSDFPIQQIKIDRSFTNMFGENKKIEAIVTAINAMAKTLEIEVVVEGVETEEQLSVVQKLNCHIVQGYLFDRPLTIEEVEKKWLAHTI